MASEVGIVNAALIKIGAKNTITSFTDGTPGGNYAAARYAEIRDDLLRAHPWNFAVRRSKLARSSDTPDFEYAYKYALPNLWLKVLGAWDNSAGDGALDYKQEGSFLFTDSEDVYCKYIIQVVDPNTMTSDFRECLALKMGVELAIYVSNSNSMSEMLQQRFESALLKAQSMDSADDRPDRMPAGSWYASRRATRNSDGY